MYTFAALKPGFRSLATLKLVVFCRRTLNQKQQLLHRAVSLRQHCFLVLKFAPLLYCTRPKLTSTRPDGHETPLLGPDVILRQRISQSYTSTTADAISWTGSTIYQPEVLLIHKRNPKLNFGNQQLPGNGQDFGSVMVT